MALTLQQKMSIERMLELGVPKAQIARELGIARPTIYEHLKRIGQPAGKSVPPPEFPPLPTATEVTKDDAKRVLAAMILDESGRTNPTDRQRAMQRYAELEGWAMGAHSGHHEHLFRPS